MNLHGRELLACGRLAEEFADMSPVHHHPGDDLPFLLFNSSNPEYQRLHEEILRYLRFLRDQAVPDLDKGLIDAWYRFKEVKQNWLGYTLFGNEGPDWARTSPWPSTARSGTSWPTSARRRSRAAPTWRSSA
jgi:hypothetical protein